MSERHRRVLSAKFSPVQPTRNEPISGPATVSRQNRGSEPTDPGSAERPWTRIGLYGIDFDPVTESDLIAHIFTSLDRGVGGRIVTPNVDIMRIVRKSDEARSLVSHSDIVVADGMPLLWAGRIARTPFPARVPGSDLIWSLSGAAADHGRSVYLLGGDTGVPEKAATKLRERFDGLVIAGTDSPPFGFDKSDEGIAATVANVVAAKPDIVFVGLGFPRQERLMVTLAEAVPSAWFLGCGASIPFVAGTLNRAPEWMRRSGLEWVHRLASEPRRLFARYVLHDAPFAARLLTHATATRLRREP